MKLTKAQLLNLFTASLGNATNLYESAYELCFGQKKKIAPSLGLAELALEELGKSYGCLAYYHLANDLKDWKIFWKEWRNHDLKAYRAFFYEFFCLLRIEMQDNEIKKNFPSFRKKFSNEKEMSFYVDVDKNSGNIIIPEIEISHKECINRIGSLLGLFNASNHVKDWMAGNESEEFKDAISEYAFKTISTDMYQQEVESVLFQMRNNSADHDKALSEIKYLFLNSVKLTKNE